MSVMMFNHSKTVVTGLPDSREIGDWSADDLPVDDWKYADVHYVYPRTNSLVRRVIDAAPISGLFKRVLVDVKVQDLVPEVCSCIPGWHLDGAFPQEGRICDRHHLFIMNGPLTEFIDEPVMIDVRRDLLPDMTHILRQIPRDMKITTCAPNAITSFTSSDFHRGVMTDRPTRRLLVRLTETNTVLARNKPQAPSVGARSR